MAHYFEQILNQEDIGKLPVIKTIPDFLEYIKHYGDTTALQGNDGKVNYMEMDDNIGKIRNKLELNGFKKGDNIAVFMPNSVFSIQAFLAIISYGCCVILLPLSLPQQALNGCIMKYDIKGIFSANGDNIDNVTVMNTDISNLTYIDSVQSDPQDAAVIFLTGGTTGTPKGAVLSHQALLRGSYNGALIPDGMFGRNTYAILPFHHVFGMIRSVLSFLYTGSTVNICSDMKAIFKELPIYQPDILVLVPGLAEVLLQVMKMKGADAHGGKLKLIISGGAAVPQKTIDAFLEFGVSMCPGYGLTETANLVSGNVHPQDKPGSVGKIYPEQEIKIENDEILIRGDNIMSGYYNDPQATAEVIKDGWFHTGDLGKIDEDGFIYITGRIKNLIILSNGINVAPEEIENLLYAKNAVKDCLVKDMDGTIGVEIQLQPMMYPNYTDEELMREAKVVVQAVNKELEEYKQIRKIVVRRDDFEKTGSLKVKR